MRKFSSASKLFFKKNASTVLTIIGAAGVVATGVMVAKATPKAMELIKEAEIEKGENLTKLEKVKVAGPVYIPTIVVGTSTIAAIFGAQILNKRTQASLMSAYAFLDNSYKEYKNKVKELLGEEAELEIVESIAKDKYNDIQVEEDKQLFYDEFSGRYFNSTMEEIIHAEYLLNKRLKVDYVICVNNFYELLGLDPIDGGDELGWSEGSMFDMYWNSWLDFHHEKVVTDDGLECYIIRFGSEPYIDYLEY